MVVRHDLSNAASDMCTVGRISSKSARTGPFARPLARSLAPFTHLLAPHCSLGLRASLRSFARSLAHSLALSLTRSRAHGKEVYDYEMNASISYCFNPTCHLQTPSASHPPSSNHLSCAQKILHPEGINLFCL